MHVAPTHQSEIQLTLELTVDMVNAYGDDELDVRKALVEGGFPRAAKASAASIARVRARLAELSPFFVALPDLDALDAAAQVNEELTELTITPSVVAHDGVGPHIHWTSNTATFDDQVIADVLMALTQELCDNGADRFGRCAADDCDRLFYDGTRNRSRRFCADPRCASRTHTAQHRARKKKT